MFYQWFSTKGERFPFRVEWLPLLVHNSAADSREHSRVAKYKVRGGGKKSIESSASFGSRRRTEKRKIPGGRLAPPITNGIYSTTSPLVRRRSVFSGGGEVCGGSRGEKNIYGLEFNEGGFWPPHWIFTLVEIPPGNYLPLPRRKNLPRALSNCQTCVDSLLEQAKVFFFPEDGLR